MKLTRISDTVIGIINYQFALLLTLPSTLRNTVIIDNNRQLKQLEPKISPFQSDLFLPNHCRC